MSEHLQSAVAEIEAHVAASGWDRPPALFALVRAGRFAADDPATAAKLGLDALPPDALTPVEQDELPDEPLDDVLAGVAWPDSIAGCAVTQEILVLPPDAETQVDTAAGAAAHPERREARLVVGVLRGGTSFALLRLRADASGPSDEVVTAPDLAPNLSAALLATLD